MKFLITLALSILLFQSGLAQTGKSNFQWNGYGQFRLYKNGSGSQGVMVRRIKLWVKGEAPGYSNLKFKVQGNFEYKDAEQFRLLDAYGDFTFKNGYLRFGQQTPEFSLQRLQSDWKIPLLERASVINSLIPAAQTSARDVGLQLHLLPFTKIWEISFGVYDGKGAKIAVAEKPDFLYTFRSSVNLSFTENYSLHLGISGMYREAHSADFSKIFGQGKPFTGRDLRFGVESLLKLAKIEIQAEYLEARLNDKKAYGFYTYVNYNFSGKNQIVVNVQKYADINPKTKDDIWLIAGYNHLYLKNKVKLMLSGGTQFDNDYSIAAQLQIFFN